MSRLLCEDEPPDLSVETIEGLRQDVVDTKEELKMQKEMLVDAFDRMRVLIPEWQRRA